MDNPTDTINDYTYQKEINFGYMSFEKSIIYGGNCRGIEAKVFCVGDERRVCGDLNGKGSDIHYGLRSGNCSCVGVLKIAIICDCCNIGGISIN